MREPSRRRLVLVADDDPRVRAAVIHLLRTTDTLAVTDQPETADIALVDVSSRTITAALDLIRRLAPRITVIAYGIDATNRSVALAAGASAFLEKDGDTKHLLDALHNPPSPR